VFPEDGSYFINATVVDNAGNESLPSINQNYLIDTIAPVIQSAQTKSPNIIELSFDSNIEINTFDKSKITLTGYIGYEINSAQIKIGDTKTIQLVLNQNLAGSESGKISIQSGSGLSEAVSGNEVLASNQDILDKIVPQNPASLSIILNGNSVELSWDLVSDAKYYEIWRSSSPYQKIAETSVANYIDTNIEVGKTYSYKVLAVDKNGNVSNINLANEISISIPLPQIQQPVVIKVVEYAPVQYQPAISSSSTIKEQEIQIDETPEEVQGTTTEKELDYTNWPLIIGLILAGLVLLFWLYYWYLTRLESKKLNQIRSFKTLRKIRQTKSRSKTTRSRPVLTRVSSRGRPKKRGRPRKKR
jgi:hypothetical protein